MLQYGLNHFPDIRVFVQVAHAGSFNRAAKALAQTNSAVSKAVRRLEQTLGVRLLLRTTRRVSLTDEGRSYLQDCERILCDIEAATDAVSLRKGLAQGLLRVQFPPLWGREAVLPLLPQFMREYPGIQLQIIVSERRLDPIDNRIDLSVRVGMAKEVGLVAKPLLPTRAVIAATPGYLESAGTPATPSDLRHHACIHYLSRDGFRPLPWMLLAGAKIQRRTFPSVLMVNDPLTMREAVLAGLGLAQGPDFLFADAFRSGRLVQVLKSWEAPGPSICLVWRQDPYMSRRVRVFVDWLIKVIKK